MSEHVDMTPSTLAVLMAALAAAQWLFQWGFQRFVKRADQREEQDEEGIRASLARIEGKLSDMLVELRLIGSRVSVLEKGHEHLAERINGGLTDHRGRLDMLTERMVRVETRLEDDDE